jgi:tight adherence protein C
MQPIIFLICVLFMGSTFLFSLSLVPQQSEVSKRLKELEGLKWEPKTTSRAEIFGRLFTETQRVAVQQQLMEAGWHLITPAQIAVRALGACGVGLSLGLLLGQLMGWSFLYILATVLFTIGGLYLPFSQLSTAVKERKIQLMRGLPDFLDMLSSTVQAGLAFNAALGYAIEVTSGALREEIHAVLSEIRMGRSRADAMKSMASRVRQPDISAMVTSIVQAERLGSNLGKVLNELADEARNKRMMRAEEIAALMPVKMIIPMALFMLPALFVMIFGPVVARYFSSGG